MRNWPTNMRAATVVLMVILVADACMIFPSHNVALSAPVTLPEIQAPVPRPRDVDPMVSYESMRHSPFEHRDGQPMAEMSFALNSEAGFEAGIPSMLDYQPVALVPALDGLEDEMIPRVFMELVVVELVSRDTAALEGVFQDSDSAIATLAARGATEVTVRTQLLAKEHRIATTTSDHNTISIISTLNSTNVLLDVTFDRAGEKVNGAIEVPATWTAIVPGPPVSRGRLYLLVTPHIVKPD